jgi:hypothetical protein
MMKEFFDICRAVNYLFISPDLNQRFYTAAEDRERLKEYMAEKQKNNPIDTYEPVISRNIVTGGSTYMSIKDTPYFMLMPEPENGWKSGLLDVEKYCRLFAALGSPDTLKLILWLCELPLLDVSNNNKLNHFTKKEFKNKLDFTDEQAEREIENLINLKLITRHEMELDESTAVFYKPTLGLSPVLPLLTIAREIITQNPDIRGGFWGGHRWNNNRVSLI